MSAEATLPSKDDLLRWGFDDPLFEEEPFRRLAGIVSGLGSVLVAYSGGADSALLLRVSRAILGEKARGVLAVSESLDRNELDGARSTAESMGVPLEIIETREYDNPEYRKNDGNRCYHCKSELFSEVRSLAAREGVPWVLDGSNADDAGDHRPGLRARSEQGVRSPLLEAGLDKASVRRYSRALGLRTWDKPAAPCLSSRIPYGSEVTMEKLRQIEASEKALRDMGFRVVRVRHHDALARIEMPLEDIPRLLEPAARDRAIRALKAAGFLFVSVDLDGFRSGSLNAALVTLEPMRSGSGHAPAARESSR
jgi:uncharacterized protein